MAWYGPRETLSNCAGWYQP